MRLKHALLMEEMEPCEEKVQGSQIMAPLYSKFTCDYFCLKFVRFFHLPDLRYLFGYRSRCLRHILRLGCCLPFR